MHPNAVDPQPADTRAVQHAKARQLSHQRRQQLEGQALSERVHRSLFLALAAGIDVWTPRRQQLFLAALPASVHAATWPVDKLPEWGLCDWSLAWLDAIERVGFTDVSERQEFFARVHQASLSTWQRMWSSMSSTKATAKAFAQHWQSWMSSGQLVVTSTASDVRVTLREHPFVMAASAQKAIAWWCAAAFAKGQGRPTHTIRPDGALQVVVPVG